MPTIEIEVTETLEKQYGEVCDEFGEETVQADLLNTIIGPINQAHQQLDGTG